MGANPAPASGWRASCTGVPAAQATARHHAADAGAEHVAKPIPERVSRQRLNQRPSQPRPSTPIAQAVTAPVGLCRVLRDDFRAVSGTARRPYRSGAGCTSTVICRPSRSGYPATNRVLSGSAIPVRPNLAHIQKRLTGSGLRR